MVAEPISAVTPQPITPSRSIHHEPIKPSSPSSNRRQAPTSGVSASTTGQQAPPAHPAVCHGNPPTTVRLSQQHHHAFHTTTMPTIRSQRSSTIHLHPSAGARPKSHRSNASIVFVHTQIRPSPCSIDTHPPITLDQASSRSVMMPDAHADEQRPRRRPRPICTNRTHRTRRALPTLAARRPCPCQDLGIQRDTKRRESRDAGTAKGWRRVGSGRKEGRPGMRRSGEF
ncbi:hypothetical protein ACLOJK_023196 [Asimina triloba]